MSGPVDQENPDIARLLRLASFKASRSTLAEADLPSRIHRLLECIFFGTLMREWLIASNHPAGVLAISCGPGAGAGMAERVIP
jgi:hypothetical protein